MYSGLNDSSTWVPPKILEEQALQRGGTPWLISTEGDSLSFAQAAADVRQAAGYFAALGVRPGDRVAVMLTSGIDFVRAWLGLGRLGATAVLLNTELRGAFLRHQLQNSGVEMIVADAATCPAVDEVMDQAPQLKRLLLLGPRPATLSRTTLAWDGWRQAPAYDGPFPGAADIAAIMYTSGTSGPSKGVLMPHAHCTLYGVGTVEAVQLCESDRYYITLPLFHANGLLMQLMATLLVGIPAIIRPRLSASAWLSDIRAHGATISNHLGTTAAFVLAQPPSAHDRQHSLRALLNAPNLPAHEAAFRERFGVPHVLSGFGMTEVNIPIWGRLGQSAPGAAGWVHEQHFEVIIADSNTDQELPRGQVGEILVRPRVPFGFMTGYHEMPAKTVEAWRNLWFHTGDAGTMDASGLVTFIDRIKDCIRRRGENISASEVEVQVASLPGVAEVAAYAVASDIPGGEDEVMLAVVPQPGANLHPESLAAAADALLPRFAKPRYVRFLDELPKTATGKVQRAELRRQGTAAAHDREVKVVGG